MQSGKDHIGVSIVYFCHDGQGNFVMHKRSAQTRDEHGKWDIGGGGLELHETVESCLKKEIKEEFCADIISSKFLGFRDVHRNHNGKLTHWVALDFKILIDPAQVKNGEPHKFDDLRWFTLETCPSDSDLHSQLPIFFSKYQDQL